LPPDPAPPTVDPAEEELRPASYAELRTLKRWLAVTAVWAVAASAIAIIALLEANNDEPARDPGAVTGSQLAKVQRDIDERIDGLEERIEGLPSSDDLSKLETRLKRVENTQSQTREDISRQNDSIDDLEQRVEQAEQQSSDDAGGAQTTP
jgi:septal ring factor EnvC (AmiA/AmiB activator)